MKLQVHTEKVHIHVYPKAVANIHRNFKCKNAINGQLHQLLLTAKLEGRSPEMNVGHVIANSRTIRDLGESLFDSAICIRTVKLKSC